MKVSGKKAAENRAALVDAATRVLRERGFEGAGVAEIGREAGLTQGALYGQFGSKDSLAAAAVRKAFADGAAAWRALGETAPDPLAAYIGNYLSEAHLNDVASGCMVAACLSEVRRQDPAIGIAFTEGLSAMAEQIRLALPAGTSCKEGRRRALAILAGLAGSVAVARAVGSSDPDLAREIVAATRAELERMGSGRDALSPSEGVIADVEGVSPGGTSCGDSSC